jgi:Ohr subfamily peroxiredoxin
MPPALGGNGQGTNPEQLFAAGYAACFASALGLVGRQAKVDTKDISVTAEVGLGQDDTGFALSVVIRVELPAELEGETGELLVKQAHQVPTPRRPGATSRSSSSSSSRDRDPTDSRPCRISGMACCFVM